MSHSGLTAYQEAVIEGHKELASTLEKHGASPKPPPGLMSSQNRNRGNKAKTTGREAGMYPDWAEVLLNAHNDLDESVGQIREQVVCLFYDCFNFYTFSFTYMNTFGVLEMHLSENYLNYHKNLKYKKFSVLLLSISIIMQEVISILVI